MGREGVGVGEIVLPIPKIMARKERGKSLLFRAVSSLDSDSYSTRLEGLFDGLARLASLGGRVRVWLLFYWKKNRRLRREIPRTIKVQYNEARWRLAYNLGYILEQHHLGTLQIVLLVYFIGFL